jgi:hypothetical protein
MEKKQWMIIGFLVILVLLLFSNLLQTFADFITYNILNLEQGSAIALSVNFFIYDVIKVIVLLAIVVFAVGVIRTFITPERIRKWLSGRREGVGNVLAALLGIPTPFCSCSAVPVFIGFVESGVSTGVTFSFLIASPLINEVAIAVLLALFGWQVAVLYVVFGFIISVVAGIIIGRLGLEKEIKYSIRMRMNKKLKEVKMEWQERIDFGLDESKRITLKVIPYIIVGIAIGAIIHGFVPADFISGIAGKDNIFAVPIAVLIGIPLYSNAAGMIPIMEVLAAKGMAFGTVLAFMMSTIGLSLPEMIILKKVMKIKLLAVFILVLFISFVAAGYLFNFVLG